MVENLIKLELTGQFASRKQADQLLKEARWLLIKLGDAHRNFVKGSGSYKEFEKRKGKWKNWKNAHPDICVHVKIRGIPGA